MGVLGRWSPARRAIVVDLGGVTAPDAVTIDAVARLALTAGASAARCNCGTCRGELADLLVLTGLRDVVAELGGLSLELQREAEEREDALDVEEEAELDDPTV